MTITDLFSKRQKRLRGEAPDVFVYDMIPQELRVQIVHILRDALGDEQEYQYGDMVTRAYATIVTLLCREYGLFDLRDSKDYGDRNYLSELFNFILREVDVERVLDAVELAFQVISAESRRWDYRHHEYAAEEADGAVAELNARFQQHGVGYRFEANEIIRIDSELLHSEVVKPALSFLHAPPFKAAQDEFLLAYEHYRHGRSKEALAECLKSLESTMKVIAAKRDWQHDANATAKRLLDLMIEKELVPQFWAQHFSGLRAMLESGVPTVRNRLGGHGQGTEIVVVPNHLVAFALHQTAAAIVFLVSAEGDIAMATP